MMTLNNQQTFLGSQRTSLSSSKPIAVCFLTTSNSVALSLYGLCKILLGTNNFPMSYNIPPKPIKYIYYSSISNSLARQIESNAVLNKCFYPFLHYHTILICLRHFNVFLYPSIFTHTILPSNSHLQI
jgi:hypothetical protein